MADGDGDPRPGWSAVQRVARDPSLSSDEMRLWVIYRTYLGKDGSWAFPGDELVAEHMDCSPRTVRRYRASLLERGYLRQERRGSKPARYWPVVPDDETDGPEEPEEMEGTPFAPGDWLERVEAADSPLASDALPAGIRPLLWAGPEPPDDAPDGWSIRADIGQLGQLTSNGWSGREVGLAMIGLDLMGETGEVPERLTSGYPTRSREWEGPELWRAARDRGREWADGRSGMDDRVADLLEGGET